MSQFSIVIPLSQQRAKCPGLAEFVLRSPGRVSGAGPAVAERRGKTPETY